MAIAFLLIYGAWDAQFLKWQHQSLPGINMKGCDFQCLQLAFICMFDISLFKEYEWQTLFFNACISSGSCNI